MCGHRDQVDPAVAEAEGIEARAKEEETRVAVDDEDLVLVRGTEAEDGVDLVLAHEIEIEEETKVAEDAEDLGPGLTIETEGSEEEATEAALLSAASSSSSLCSLISPSRVRFPCRCMASTKACHSPILRLLAAAVHP